MTKATTGEIGEYIRRQRLAFPPLTQAYLAELSGLSLSTIGRLEAGGNADVDTLASVAEALGVKLGELLEAGR